MCKDITINFIIHNRLNYFEIVSRELLKLTDETKAIINVNVLVSFNDSNLKNIVDKLRSVGIKTDVFHITNATDNYMIKIRTAIKNSGTYSISIDEDIYIPTNTWEYFINNLSVLNNESNLLLSPTINTGIPSVDLFVENFLTEDEKIKLESFYKQVRIPNIWGANYSFLNKNLDRDKWNAEEFYSDVYKIDHHYRGVHPVRFSPQAQKYINDICIERIHAIDKINSFDIISLKRPYFCNSVYGIKTSVWKKIIDDSSLFRDEFDEVPLNLYMRDNNLDILFIKNGVAIHPSYNTINIYGYNYSNISDEFFKCEYLKTK